MTNTRANRGFRSDGRRHGTAAQGQPGGLDLNARTLNALVPQGEWAKRRATRTPPELVDQTLWKDICRRNLSQPAKGGCLEFATAYQRIARTLPRDKH